MAAEKYLKVALGGKMIGEVLWSLKRDELNSGLLPIFCTVQMTVPFKNQFH